MTALITRFRLWSAKPWERSTSSSTACIRCFPFVSNENCVECELLIARTYRRETALADRVFGRRGLTGSIAEAQSLVAHEFRSPPRRSSFPGPGCSTPRVAGSCQSSGSSTQPAVAGHETLARDNRCLGTRAEFLDPIRPPPALG